MEKIKRNPTGINGLDEVLAGGLPEGRSIAVAGQPGTGKTVLLSEFIYAGVKNLNEPGVFVTFEESPEDIKTNVSGFGWDFDSEEFDGKFAFVDFSPETDALTLEINEVYDLTPLVNRILNAVKKTKAKRVAIDSIASLYSRISQKDQIRETIYKLTRQLNQLGLVTLVSVEKENSQSLNPVYGTEEFVLDGVIELELNSGEQSFIRNLYVRKLRGCYYRSGIVEYEINSKGIVVFPKIPENHVVKNSNMDRKLKFGNNKIDEILGGGVPLGHLIMLSGNTGSGKSIMSMQFLHQGLSDGEHCLFVALEESITQVIKTADKLGWNYSGYSKHEKLHFVTAPLIDTSADKLLYDIVKTVEKYDIKRIVIDSVSSLESGLFNKEKVRQFMIQAARYFKNNEITCICNYLISANFGAGKDQMLMAFETNSMRLSSVVDGIIFLLYVENQSYIEKILSVLKLRGANHSRSLIRYEISSKGIVPLEEYNPE